MLRVNCRLTKYFFLFLCLLTPFFLFAQKNKKVEKPKEKPKIDTVYTDKPFFNKVGVVPFGDTLFYIHANIGTFSPKERALSVEEKITQLGNDLLFEEDSLVIADYAGFLCIMYNKDIVMSIDSIQAAKEGRTRIDIAEEYRETIIEAVYKRHQSTSWQHIMMQILGTLGILAAEYFIIFKGIRFIYRRAELFVRRRRSKEIKGVSKIIDTSRAILVIITMLKMIRFFLVIVFLYLGLMALFTLFPYTKHLSDELMNYVVSPVRSFWRSIINYMPNLITIIVIVVIFRYIRKLGRTIAEQVAEHKIIVKGFYPDWAMPTYNLFSVFVLIFMFILIFPYLPQSDSQIFQGVSVFAGIMLSLGSTSVIGNLVAGLVMTYMRPFKIGDRIKMGDHVGDVMEKTALVTRIKTPKNEVITIPNSNIMSAQTINYSASARQHGLILYTIVCVGYEVPWQKVHEMLLKVASRTESLSKKQKPFVHQDGFNDFYMEYQLNVYIRDASLMAKVYSDLRRHVQDVFAENEIEMVSPHYHVNRQVEGDQLMLTPTNVNKEEKDEEV